MGSSLNAGHLKVCQEVYPAWESAEPPLLFRPAWPREGSEANIEKDYPTGEFLEEGGRTM